MSNSVRLTRRGFLEGLAAAGLISAVPGLAGRSDGRAPPGKGIRLFLCGDVMTGRGVDQILPNPSDPAIFEPYVRDARDYVGLAESENGPISRPVGFDYVWGVVPEILDGFGTDARIVNLETAVARHPEPWPGKGINYRMHPDNVDVLTALGIDVCVLANNHVLDWQAEGLIETLSTLGQAKLGHAGAGETLSRAREPSVLELADGQRLLVFAAADPTSGVPAEWAASPSKPGVHFLPELSARQLKEMCELVKAHRRKDDVVMVSIHWGGNWGYDVPEDQRRFAHGLIEEAGVDLVHGHSSHHPKGMEVHDGRLILYGCGDFINDYEGITGHDDFRPDLVAMYLPCLRARNAELEDLLLVPLKISRMQLHRATMEDARWLAERLNQYHPAGGHRLIPESRVMGGSPTPYLTLQW